MVTNKDLNSVTKAFESWRAGRVRGRRVPKDLWAMAVSLASLHQPEVIAAELGINIQLLRKKIRDAKAKIKPECHSANIVRLASLIIKTQPPVESTRSQRSVIAELSTFQGSQLRIYSGVLTARQFSS